MSLIGDLIDRTKRATSVAILIVTAGVAVGFSNSAIAEQKVERITVGGEEFTHGQIIADFLEVAFTDHFWNQDAENIKEGGFARVIDAYLRRDHDLNSEKVREAYEQKKKWHPWFADYMYRPNGLPSHNVIRKWDKEITIGMGWPQYSPGRDERPPGRLPNQFYGGTSKEQFPLIEEALQNIIPWIKEETGLPVRLIEPADPANGRDDFTEDYARIRIIPKRNPASWRTWAIPPVDPWNPTINESWLWGSALFESSDNIHMDAYLIPDTDDRPGMVVCKIQSGFPDEELYRQYFKALVGECVTRAMGLPGLSTASEAALIGDWRRIYGFNNNERQPPAEFVFQGPTPYDRLMISILYCTAIKTGMDKNDAFEILTTNNECIGKHFK